jgi:DNA polymerase-3 subunit gamma/tau
MAPAAGGLSAARVSEGSVAAYHNGEQSGAAPTFDGNWTGFVESQNFQGMAGLLARHAEMVAFDGTHLQLVVPDAQKMYAEPAYQEKLRAALAPCFGPRLRISIKIGETAGASVAAVRGAEAQRKLDAAAAALERDPFVRDLVDGMGAKIIASSIRQAGDGEADNTEHGRLQP